MKYIIIPILKTIWLFVVLVIGYPFLIVGALLICLWQWDLKEFNEIWKMDFSDDKSIFISPGDKYYAYKNVWDWYNGKKTERTYLDVRR